MIPYQPSEKTAEAILEFHKQSYGLLNQQWNLRDTFRQIDLSYQREVDWTEEQWKARQANRNGDPTKFQNITMPVVMPQVEAAVTYQQSVFLSGFPIFGVAASPEHADAATQMDTIIGEQQIRGNWVANLLQALRNGFKYNLGPVEVSWEEQVSYANAIAGVEGDGESNRSQAKQRQVLWAGNHIKALDVYNTFFDTRVKPVDVCKDGEFAGYVELKSRIALKKMLAELPFRINVREALESGASAPIVQGSKGIQNYYVPNINPEVLYDTQTLASTNWMSWAGIADDKPRIAYKNMYEVTTLYGRILPADFGMTNVPAKNTPQVWKFIIVNNQVIVYAERLTNSHNLIPILFAQPLEDGLGYQTKSFAKNVEPFQEITTALANSTIAARRRAIADRMLYDPSRVSTGAMQSDSPVARIPVRPSAYGTPLSEAVYQIPFVDDQSQYVVQGIQQFMGMANQISGLNPARQGQFVKGNKTRYEFAETMGYANGRDQTVALTLEGNFFLPIKQVIKSNILDYQGGVDVYNRESNQNVQVDPVTIRKANLEFKVADGLLPTDKMIDGETFQQFLQALGQNPQLAAGYNVTPMISYLAKMRGAKLQPFEKSSEQMAFEQAMMQWQQAMAQVGEALQNMEPQPTPEQVQQMLPSMPKPEEFGYDPKRPQLSVQHDGQSVYGRYADMQGKMEQAQQQVAQGNAQAQGTQGMQGGGEG